MSAKEIVKKFGGQTALATMLGKGQPTVAYWVKTDRIPSKWQSILLGLAQANGINLIPEDFMVGIKNDDVIVDLSKTTVIENNADLELSDLTMVAIKNLPAEMAKNGDQNNSNFLFYASHDGSVKVQVIIGDETVWATQKSMAEIFGVDVSTINEHLKNLYQSGELEQSATIGKFPIVQNEGERQVRRDNVMFYNLDVIISVGYRVNSYQATQFRKWATGILKEFLIKGFTLDDERLKQGNQLFGKDYFDELLERIRKIRTSERMFWQKVTDLYSQCSSDYDKNSPVTQQFFAQIQNKFHYAIHHHTAAELIRERANAQKPNMGLVHFANMNKDGVVIKSDINGKNFLSIDELDELERVVENYLGAAELFAKRKIVMTMKDWVQKLDEFLRFNSYDVLSGFGKVTSDAAKNYAYAEYEKFRVMQDREYKSDFDKVVDEIKVNKRLPKPKAG